MNNTLWKRSYTCLIIANALVTASYSMFTSLLSVYVNELGFGNSVAGSMVAGLGMVLMLSKLLAGSIVDRVPKDKLFVFSAFLVLLNTAGYCFADSIPVLFFLRLFNGFTNALFIVTSSAMIVLSVDDRRVEEAVSYYRVTSSLTVAIGPVFGNILYRRYGFSPLFVSMSVLAALAAVLACAVDSADFPKPSAAAPGIKRRFSLSCPIERTAIPVAVVTIFLYMATSSVGNYLVAYGNTRGFTTTGLFFLISSLFLLLSTLVYKRFLNKLNPKVILSIGFLLIACSIFLIPLASADMYILLLSALYGFGEGLTTPLLNAIAFRNAAPERKGAAAATFSIANGIGTGIGGYLCGHVSESFGYTPMFGVSAINSVLAGIMLWLLS